MSNFKERTRTQKFTKEWIEYASNVSVEDAEERLKTAVLRFERNYNAVAQVSVNEKCGATFYIVEVIHAMDADREEISLGMQKLNNWLVNDD